MARKAGLPHEQLRRIVQGDSVAPYFVTVERQGVSPLEVQSSFKRLRSRRPGNMFEDTSISHVWEAPTRSLETPAFPADRAQWFISAARARRLAAVEPSRRSGAGPWLPLLRGAVPLGAVRSS